MSHETDGPIPKNTLARILHMNSFESESTKITEETVESLQKYMELFVREAVLRSIENKERVQNEQNSFTGARMDLTHHDLEEIAGLLLLDMS